MSWEEWLEGIDFDVLGTGDPPVETDGPDEEEVVVDRKVILQKITTEIWIYTDLESRKYGNQQIQDLVVYEEMPLSEALKIIAKRKLQQKRKKDS